MQGWVSGHPSVKFTDCYIVSSGTWFNQWNGKVLPGDGGIPQNFVLDRDGNCRWCEEGMASWGAGGAYDPKPAILELMGTNFP